MENIVREIIGNHIVQVCISNATAAASIRSKAMQISLSELRFKWWKLFKKRDKMNALPVNRVSESLHILAFNGLPANEMHELRSRGNASWIWRSRALSH